MALLYGCSANRKISNISSKFSVKGEGYSYSLMLNPDNSFILNESVIEVSLSCKGTWKYCSKDSILLSCEEEPPNAMLQSGYMVKRQRSILLIDKNHIKVDGQILVKSK